MSPTIIRIPPFHEATPSTPGYGGLTGTNMVVTRNRVPPTAGGGTPPSGRPPGGTVPNGAGELVLEGFTEGPIGRGGFGAAGHVMRGVGLTAVFSVPAAVNEYNHTRNPNTT